MLSSTIMVLFGLASGSLAQDLPPARDVMIFFDWGKSSVDRDSVAALHAGAAAFQATGGGMVSVEGHSDRSGSAAANRTSSLLRANAVRDLLVAQGIDAKRIDVAGLGEDRPLIPTEDGVREPQNRRVDVHFGADAR